MSRAYLFAATVVTATSLQGTSYAGEAGYVRVQNNPCLMAKFGQGQSCTLPPLPATRDAEVSARARLARAKHYIDLEQMKQAFAEADEALRLTPNDKDVHHLVARLAMTTGDRERAERELAVLLQKFPKDPDFRSTKATLLESNRATQEALHEYDMIISENRKHRFARENRARLLLSIGRPEQAVADLTELLALYDQQPEHYSMRATAYLAANHPKLAIADLSEVLKTDPTRLDLRLKLATALEAVGDDSGALINYTVVLGPVGGEPAYALAGEQVGKLLARRAFLQVRLKRFDDAVTDVMSALNAGGHRVVLRLQVFLRHNGFPDTPLDGKESVKLREALAACFGLNSCFEKISDTL